MEAARPGTAYPPTEVLLVPVGSYVRLVLRCGGVNFSMPADNGAVYPHMRRDDSLLAGLPESPLPLGRACRNGARTALRKRLGLTF